MEAIKIARMDNRGRVSSEERERVRPLLIDALKELGSVKPLCQQVGMTPKLLHDLVPNYRKYLSEKSLNKGRRQRKGKKATPLVVAKKRKYTRRAKLGRSGRVVSSPKLRPMLVSPVDLESDTSCTVIVVRGTNVMQALLAAAAEHAK